ncbi:IcmT/TraK family protein [Cupriavidus nantongensis]|uniref:Phosphoesterase n=1 Tax=Cupriavidus nantongensis TaxID=1796606 RepID=A0A142JKJ9_9BURK|nr:hypothetical protein A2G96_13145 [Cupriavidus nantongensis]
MTGRKSIWRDAARTPRIASVDARAFFPLIFALFHMRVWTFCLAFVVVVMFRLMETRGYTLPVFLRAVRHWLRGRSVPSRGWWVHRRFFD